MSTLGNSVNLTQNKFKLNPIIDKPLINNSTNIYMEQNIKQNSTISINPSKSAVLSKDDYNIFNNKKNSFQAIYDNKTFIQNKMVNNNKNLSVIKTNIKSSGILKPSRRNPKHDKVIKNGAKIKNIDINRDYDDDPSDDDTSSNMSIINYTMKNNLVKLNKNNNLKNEENNNIPDSKNNDNEPNNLKPKETINKENNINNKKENKIVIENQNFSISKQKELSITKPEIKHESSNQKEIIENLDSINIVPDSTNDKNKIFSNLKDLEISPQEALNHNEIKTSLLGKGFRFCSSLSKAGKSINGLEKTNQDTPLVCISVGGIKGFNIFGVLDGHGMHGHLVSQFLKKYFLENMKSYLKTYLQSDPLITAEEIYYFLKSEEFYHIIELFNNADTELRQKASFDFYLSGSTCNLLFQFDNHLVDFSVGDSRSIIIEDNGSYSNQIIQLLSLDHKPNLPTESLRIEIYGGELRKCRDFYGKEAGPLRVFKKGCTYPGLAMSRSLGDLQAKECGVISTPEIIEYEINFNSKFAVICSDGIWDVLKNENVRDIGNKFYYKNDAAGFCKELINLAVNKWTQIDNIRDDITVVSVFF